MNPLILLGLDAAIALGALPDPSPGGRINAAIGFPLGSIDLWLEAGFTGWRPSERIDSSTDRIDADLGLCALAPLERFELGGCAGVRFGRLSVESDEPTDARFLFSIGAEARAGWKPIEQMALVLSAGVSKDLLSSPSAYGVMRAGIRWKIW